MLAVVERQSSQGSSVASERISAVVAVDRVQNNEKYEPVDLDNAEKLEGKLRASMETVRKRMTDFIAGAPANPADYTEEQRSVLQDLAKGIKQIKAAQENLKQDMIYARKERRKAQAEQKQRAMKISQPKSAPPIRMEELRALNMVQLDESDMRSRYELAQKPKPIIPSGGFTGFRVAPDLKRMDFSHSDPNHPDKLEAWRPDVQNKRST